MKPFEKVLITAGCQMHFHVTIKLSRLWTTLLGLLLLITMGHSLTITVAVKEEKPIGTKISDLMADKSFQDILRKDMGSRLLDNPATSPSLHFSILTSGNPSSQYFSIDEKNGLVVTTEKIDREKVCSFTLDCQLTFEVAVKSVYGSFFTLVNFEVLVLDINDNPPEYGQSDFELFIPENSNRGRAFQLPVAFDRDTGFGNGVENYELLSEEALFGIETTKTPSNTSDVFLILKSTVNRENASAYSVLVGAVDGGIPPLTGTLTVKVLISDINDNFPVFEKSLYTISVPEDRGLDHPVVKVHASDADEGANGQLLYSFSPLQPPANLAFFRIDSKSGEIFLSQSLESKTGKELELIVDAQDQGHPPKLSHSRVKVFVQDTINSMPEIIVDTLGGTKDVAFVSEYAKMGRVVLHVSVQDPDSGENGRTSCKLDTAEFGLSSLGIQDKYKVVVNAVLDRETKQIYNTTITCEDHGATSLLASKEFAVQILDENDNPPQFSLRTYETSIHENNTIGASVFQLTVSDKDIGINAEMEYTVVGINQNFFSVNEDGLMTAKMSLDREESSRIITKIIAKDKGFPPMSASTTVVVDLLDVNDMPPVFSKPVYHFEVDEEQKAGRYVGIVTASDLDIGKNKRILYRLARDNENSFVVGSDGGVIKTNSRLDREKQDTYEIIILAVDQGSPALTGQTKVIIHLTDVNDNLPYFIFPSPENDTLDLPHSFEADVTIVEILAADNDTGPNSQLMFSLSSINETSPFAIDSDSGALYLHRSLTSDDLGFYTLTLVASDKGLEEQWATQTPLYMNVYFDNSTLLSAMSSAGPSKTLITILIAVAAILLLAVIIFVTFCCIKRYEAKKRSSTRFPVSASTLSTTKLQGGYYIAPGVQNSTSSFFGKPEDMATDLHQDNPDGEHAANSYMVMFPQPVNTDVGPSEVVQIGRNGRHGSRCDNAINPVDLDQTDDGQFSTFKSHDNLSVDRRQNSLRRQSVDTCEKGANGTFDNEEDLSCDSTSDSGRGGSDMDVNSGAAAANKEKARAAAATPVSVKSGISDRLSPLPRDQKGTFVTFRGESPSSFRFDSDSDTTLTRPSQRSGFNPMPVISSPPEVRHASQYPPRLSESDTDSDFAVQGRSNGPTPAVASIYSPHTGGGMYGGGVTFRQPYRVAPLPMFMPPSSHQRSESETEHSDGGSNQSSSSSRRNYVPRLPLYPGIEFSHHAYGGSNRNSIGAFSNVSSASNRENYSNNTNRNSQAQVANFRLNRPDSVSSDGSQALPPNSVYNSNEQTRTDPRMSANYGNVISELETSRPVSMEDDFLLPPYPHTEEEDERNNLLMNSGYTGFNTPSRNREQDALVMRSRYESSA